MAVSWCIWSERNERVFENKESEKERTWDREDRQWMILVPSVLRHSSGLPMGNVDIVRFAPLALLDFDSSVMIAAAAYANLNQALGDYTRMVNDFSVFPADPTEGRVGQYWYHEGTKAFFDDLDHFKMIKATCRLSCVVCDKMDEQGDKRPKRTGNFRNIEQLKSHLFHNHKLFMCVLCLEGRKLHFRQLHYLCENEDCLAKKFVVFISDMEMKMHVALEHGGQMSRPERNAALQVPTSFRYRRNIEQDRRQRRQILHLDFTDAEVRARLDVENSDDTARATSSNDQPDSHHRDSGPLESSSTTDSESSSTNHLAQRPSSTTIPLEPSSFPPLPKASRTARQKSHNENSLAARIRRRNSVTVVHPSRAWPAVGRQPTPTTNTSQVGPALSYGRITSLSTASSSTSVPTTGNRFVPSKNSSSSTSVPTIGNGFVPPKNSIAHVLVSARTNNTAGPNKVDQSASGPSNRSSFEPSISNFPPVSATLTSKPATSEPLPIREDVHTANKALVDKIRAGLEFDDDKFAVFKVISAEYRQNLIGTSEYLAYVHQFGISHLIPELARLCPDGQKQKELLVACNISLRGSSNGIEIGAGKNSSQLKTKKGSKKGKEKVEDNIISSVRELQLSYKPSQETIEVLSKDGYRSNKGKSKVDEIDEPPGLSFPDRPQSEPIRENDSKKAGGGKKQQKKMSKFHRVRLGDSSPAAVLDLTNSSSALTGEKSDSSNDNHSEALPVRSVWQNGGGHKLVGKLATAKKGHGQ
ncbi:hypothetical protein LguiB_021604 [Lonicera macranthoides]